MLECVPTLPISKQLRVRNCHEPALPGAIATVWTAALTSLRLLFFAVLCVLEKETGADRKAPRVVLDIGKEPRRKNATEAAL
jgi:hypothetical protein